MLVPECLQDKPLAEAFSENLKRLEVCCQKGLVERFDASIGAASVLMPFAGKYQLTPEDAMVAKLPVIHGETDDAKEEPTPCVRVRSLVQWYSNASPTLRTSQLTTTWNYDYDTKTWSIVEQTQK